MSSSAELFFFCKRTFGNTASLVLNVHFCRKQTFLQKRTFRTTADLVLNVHFCSGFFFNSICKI